MSAPLLLIIGSLLGVLTRSLAPGDFFDPKAAFWTTQLILSGVAAFISFKHGFLKALVMLVGAYLASNLYAYAYGSSETRAWALLGAFSSLFVIFCYPGLAGLLGGLLRKPGRR